MAILLIFSFSASICSLNIPSNFITSSLLTLAAVVPTLDTVPANDGLPGSMLSLVSSLALAVVPGVKLPLPPIGPPPKPPATNPAPRIPLANELPLELEFGVLALVPGRLSL